MLISIKFGTIKRIAFMTDFLNRFDVVVVKFPFASSLKYKARPAVVISTKNYNQTNHNTLIIVAISSQLKNISSFESEIKFWKEAGLLKPSIFKSSVATIEQESVLSKLGSLSDMDKVALENILDKMCISD